jgi:hypothetical protein
MTTTTLRYRNWTFEVDRDLTHQTYAAVVSSGADSCVCSDCKNYVAYRSQAFPVEIATLLADLGIDYRKEVEVFRYEVLSNGLHHLAGWFHFKGRVLAGPDYRVPLPGGGHALHLTRVAPNFSIGFAEGSDLAHFEDKTALVQVEFETTIPRAIDKLLETSN